MAIAKALQAPEWISSGAVIAGGLDLLGLRLPVQFIGGTLLDGVTTVTPSVRYLSFRAWLIHCYGQTGQPDHWQVFTDFAARMESALVLGNLTQDRSISGLIGADQALVRLDANTPQVEVSALVKSPASTIYTGPSDQLGLSKTRDNAVPALVDTRGLPLALGVHKRLARVSLIERLVSEPNMTKVSMDDLRELGTITRIDQIPDDERELLLAAIVPSKPLPKERARVGTYAALLALATKMKAQPTEGDLFDTACSMNRFGEPLLDQVAGGWTFYCVRDAIAVTQEAVLAAVMDEIMASPDDGLAGVARDGVVGALMERIDEHDSALRDLGLLGVSESVTSLSFREVHRRIEDRVSADSVTSNNIKRWPDTLTEPRLYKRALKSGAGALSLAVVAWMLAAIRVGDAVRENGQESGSLSYQGWRRLGLRDVILPELERFHREDRPMREVAAQLAYRTVQQHLQITWSRLQVDLRRDVGLLTAEGNQWYSRRKGFVAGRTASRIQQALGWLSQLKLIDAGGITADGDVVLKRAFKVLSEGAVA
ncbi:hypothetical protein [Burkholderia vietnamiensis]|uniref:hypothetical protein n=1 Tax=Burkholderia vietnamiensis TaxID=60552 RepID=UPI001592ECE0|nr:hypothetical protein [Burkholderia vietnamiensis]